MSNVPVPPGIAYLADNIISRHNIMGSPPGDRARWARGLTFSPESDTVFFAGCGYQYSAQLENFVSLARKLDASAVGSDAAMRLGQLQQKLGLGRVVTRLVGGSPDSSGGPLRDAVAVLQRLGLKLGYLGEEEPCCGGLLYYAGMHRKFGENAAKAFHVLKDRGIRKIISIVPSCTYTLRDLFPKFVPGFDIQIKHFSEVVADLLGSRELKSDPLRITYHDPCQMSRYLNLTAPPRRAIAAVKGIELVEPQFTAGAMSTCCGGGGGFEAVFPELSQILAANRARELAATGAQAIVTQCPGCIIQLESGLKQLKIDNVKVVDLAQILAAAKGL